MRLLHARQSQPFPAQDASAGEGAGKPGACRRHEPIPPQARSCCCPAEPVGQVILVPTGDRAQEPDLLLCAHHLRRSARALRERGAVVYGRDGNVLDDLEHVFATDR